MAAPECLGRDVLCAGGAQGLLCRDAFPGVFAVPCYSVELHTWESRGSRWGDDGHPSVLSLVVSGESVFLLFWLFYQVRYEGIMFRFSLPPFPEKRRGNLQ